MLLPLFLDSIRYSAATATVTITPSATVDVNVKKNEATCAAHEVEARYEIVETSGAQNSPKLVRNYVAHIQVVGYINLAVHIA